MMVTIHQPCYIPYMGVFHKIWKADAFVYLDDAQYSNGYVFDWNRIKTPQGECRLKVPLEKKFGQSLMEVKPKDFLGWQLKHLKTIEMNYKKAPYFDTFFPAFEMAIVPGFTNLAELNISVMSMLMEWFDIKKPIYFSHVWNLESRSEARVIEITHLVSADAYLSGTGGRNYQDETHFTEAGIKLQYQQWEPMPYHQQWGEFRPYMSVIDFAMNEGHDIGSHFRRMEEIINGG
ncbi:MAG: WbqC family protein [Lachnospiraceae bacterium]|nr:WbqC family protein [Lachnospiraceae bacterium]